jgi:hypothetical protein
LRGIQDFGGNGGGCNRMLRFGAGKELVLHTRSCTTEGLVVQWVLTFPVGTG